MLLSPKLLVKATYLYKNADSARFYEILRDSARFYKILHDSARYNLKIIKQFEMTQKE